MVAPLYRTGLFALEIGDWDVVQYEPGAPEVTSPIYPHEILAKLPDNPEDWPETERIPTMAQATCQIDLLGQVLIEFQVIVAEGFGSPYYEFAPRYYLRQDRVRKVVDLLVVPDDMDAFVEHQWEDVDLELDDNELPQDSSRAQVAFEAMMEAVGDMMRMTPLTDDLIAKLRTVGIWPPSLLDELIAQYGRHRFGPRKISEE
jgi:hypothetical protein